ncbi:MAG TPA: hypothetical protein VNU46_06540 [Gemmatimonadaceae bacterium]|jgi:hypothetical protein|nr:hypothetical protein [Gemmatimonadaceae bacterium]
MLTSDKTDLFIRLSKLTPRREDFFTECLAATLRENPNLARRYVETLCGGAHFEGVNLRSASIDVETQWVSQDQTCRIDMRLHIGGRHIIAVEHKLLAPEGSAQLERYLGLPHKHVTHVAYITGYFAKAPSGIQKAGARYLRPKGGHWHFLWSDFYHVFSPRETTLQRAMHELFDAWLFQPEHWYVGRLNSRDETERAAADRKFAKLLRPTIRTLEGRRWGYEVGPSWTSRSELYAIHGKSKRVPEVRIDPRFNPGALKVVLKTPSKNQATSIETQLKNLPEPLRTCTIVRQKHLGYSGRGVPYAVEVLTPWSYLLRRYKHNRDATKMAAAIARHITRILEFVA